MAIVSGREAHRTTALRRRVRGDGRPLWVADSTGQRNILTEHLSRALEAKGLPWAFVPLSRNGVELDLRELGDINALGQVLPEQAIGVLVAAALPGAPRVAEVNLDVGDQSELLVRRHLLASVPGQ